MSKIESKISVIKQNPETIYEFLCDFRNFKQIIEEKADGFEGDKEWAAFEIPNLGKGKLSIIEKEAPKLIKIDGEGAGHKFSMWIQIKKNEEMDSRIKITMEPHINPALLLMVKSHIKNFVDTLADNMQKLNFEKKKGS